MTESLLKPRNFSDIPFFNASSDGVLTEEMRHFYEQEGYLVLTGFFSKEEADKLKARAGEIITTFRNEENQSIFSTISHAQSTSELFRKSARGIQLFYEEEAYDQDGRLVPCKEKAINKISHALHDQDPIFKSFSYQPKIRHLVHSLGYQEPKLLQSMYIYKQPYIGGEVVYHQDATFLYTEPMTTMGLWFALEDATQENACLRAIPGEHRSPLRRRYVRQGNELIFKELDGTSYPTQKEVFLEVPQGSVILLHGLLPHASSANHSPFTRQAYTLHLIDGKSMYEKENWLQETESMPFQQLMG